jgi:toxin-antitoxin system PIN domain toxin
MIAIDTNILVYAHRPESPFFDKANAQVRDLAEGGQTWAIPWPCVSEFYSVVTNPKMIDVPTPPEAAIAQLDAWMESPTLTLLGETRGSWAVLRNQLIDGKVVGRRAHDARIAALCLAHGVRELWTADRDYGRFPALRSRNPLLGAA